jgi:hypothetical protein
VFPTAEELNMPLDAKYYELNARAAEALKESEAAAVALFDYFRGRATPASEVQNQNLADRIRTNQNIALECLRHPHAVRVHAPVGTRDGGVVPVLDARTASVGTASTSRFCWRQLATTVSTRSTNRLPDAPSVPPLVFRQHTA